MSKRDLNIMWEKLRNSPWQKQEEFVQLLIDEMYACRNELQFMAEDKYVGPSGFKHVDGNVRGRVALVLGHFEAKWEQFDEQA